MKLRNKKKMFYFIYIETSALNEKMGTLSE